MQLHPLFPRSVLIALLAAVALGLTGCAMTEPKSEARVAASDGDTPAAKDPAAAEAEKKEKAEKEAEEEKADARQLDKLQRDLEIAKHKLERTKLGQADDMVNKAFALTKAEKELGMEHERVKTFTEQEVPQRIERSQLDLARAEDRAVEAREELHQLELMYGEEDFADQTKEIVLERGRRRLERSQVDLELRRRAHDTLVNKTIPMETREREMKVEQKTADVEQLRRGVDAMTLDHQIKLLSAEGEIAGIEAQIETLNEKIEKRRSKSAQASAK